MSPATTRRSPAMGSVHVVDPAHQRVVRDLRGEAGDLRRIGAVLRDAVQKVDDFRQDRNAAELHRPFEDREIGVEPLRGE